MEMRKWSTKNRSISNFKKYEHIEVGGQKMDNRVRFLLKDIEKI